MEIRRRFGGYAAQDHSSVWRRRRPVRRSEPEFDQQRADRRNRRHRVRSVSARRSHRGAFAGLADSVLLPMEIGGFLRAERLEAASKFHAEPGIAILAAVAARGEI